MPEIVYIQLFRIVSHFINGLGANKLPQHQCANTINITEMLSLICNHRELRISVMYRNQCSVSMYIANRRGRCCVLPSMWWSQSSKFSNLDATRVGSVHKLFFPTIAMNPRHFCLCFSFTIPRISGDCINNKKTSDTKSISKWHTNSSINRTCFELRAISLRDIYFFSNFSCFSMNITATKCMNIQLDIFFPTSACFLPSNLNNNVNYYPLCQ